MGIAQDLRQTVAECHARGLLASAKWAAHQLAGLSQDLLDAEPAEPARPVSGGADEDAYLLARSMFDLREYESASHALVTVSSSKQISLSSKSLFLQLYCDYLTHERLSRKKHRGLAESIHAAPVPAPSPGQEELRARLAKLASARSDDAYIQYLYGMVLIDGGSSREAACALSRSVCLTPWHWGAWQALLQCRSGDVPLASPPLPQHPARQLFEAARLLAAHDPAGSLRALASLGASLPGSEALLSAAAAAHYQLQAYDTAAELFAELLAREPHRVEGTDLYSNVLYVRDARAELAALAARVSAGAPRPDALCVVGNLHSLAGRHEQAAQAFRRALRLDPHCLSAWTLMGHEYVELKSPRAAAAAYRAAVRLDPRDYRAWYGLGQSHELLGQPLAALHHFKRAAALRPDDARAWSALGHCAAQAGGPGSARAAAAAYARAAPLDRDGVALPALAALAERAGDAPLAELLYRASLEEGGGAGAVTALEYLAREARARGDESAAEEYYSRLLDCGTRDREAAKEALRQSREEEEADA